VLSAIIVGCWIVPALRGDGLYGGGLVKVVHAYAGLFAVVAWAASLAIAVSPARYRRALALRLMAVVGALLVAMPLGDLASVLWSIRVGNIYYYAQCFSRSQNVSDPELVWKRAPGLHWRGRKTSYCDEVVYRTDENGFRNRPGIRRADIVVVGDSVTEAGEIDEAATYVGKAGALLGLKAVNLGTSGYGPQQELAVVKRYGLAYKPRLVVWQFTEWNDLFDAYAYRIRHAPPAQLLPTWGQLYMRHSPIMRLASAFLPDRQRNAVDYLRSDGQLEKRIIWPYEPDVHQRLPEAFAETQQAIQTAFETCQAQQVDFAVLYVPSQVRVLLPYLRFKNDAQRDRVCPGGVADRADDLAHAMQEFCARLHCPMIDMTPRLRQRAAVDNRRLYVRDDPHLDIDGHDEVAQALIPFVREGGGFAAHGAGR
jgi:hypothetical protein